MPARLHCLLCHQKHFQHDFQLQHCFRSQPQHCCSHCCCHQQCPEKLWGRNHWDQHCPANLLVVLAMTALVWAEAAKLQGPHSTMEVVVRTVEPGEVVTAVAGVAAASLEVVPLTRQTLALNVFAPGQSLVPALFHQLALDLANYVALTTPPVGKERAVARWHPQHWHAVVAQ